MSRSFVRHHRWALVATFALLLAGCSSPTAPNLASGPPAPPSNEVTNPTFVTVPVLPDGAAAAMAAGSAPVPVPAPEPEPISDVAVVDGRDGGVFRVGRFTLHVGCQGAFGRDIVRVVDYQWPRDGLGLDEAPTHHMHKAL